MSILPKEVVRKLVREGNFKDSNDILSSLKEMMKDVLQEAMEAEIEQSLEYEKFDRSNKNTRNSRNGYSKKTVKSQLGEIELDIPRDRLNDFEPQIIPKYERNITGLEEKIISLYTSGLSTRDIHDQMQDLYGVEVSSDMVSKITDKVLPLITEWQNRPLDKHYAFVFLDAIHYKVRDEKQVVNKAAYVILGVTTDGFKEILGIYIGVNESAKFWLSVLNELKNRGVQDVGIFCVDGLAGFSDAIKGVFPNALIQRCIIHQIRASTRYVSYKDIKEFTKDLKTVYTAVSEEEGYENLMVVKDKWEHKYPSSIKSWEQNWGDLSTFFMFSPEIRKIIYTTNAIEGLHRQFRKVTKTKSVFPSDKSLLKMLYLSSEKIQQKWTIRYRNWDLVISQLSILMGDRLEF